MDSGSGLEEIMTTVTSSLISRPVHMPVLVVTLVIWPRLFTIKGSFSADTGPVHGSDSII